MAKYHVNGKGEAGVCHATKNCPFGDLVSDHYSSKVEAQKAYEEKMSKVAIKSKSKNKTNVVAPPLSNIMDTQKLKELVDGRYVMVSEHPDDRSLKVLTYSPTTQHEGKWNEVTTQARGLIIKSEKDNFSDAVIIERPWRKFFTLQQMESSDGKRAWALGDEEDGDGDNSDLINNIDFNAPAEVTDKMDGSLGILYRAPDGKLALSTKGSFKSEQADDYTRMLRKDPELYEKANKLSQSNPGKTFLFEMTGANNQIVLEYDEDEITLLGAVDKESGHYHSPNDYVKTWDRVTETMPAKNLQEALSLPDRPNREGVVVRMMSDDAEKQFQIKIKQEDYVKLHRMMTGLSKKGAREIVKEANITGKDLLKIAKSKNVEEISEVKEILEPIKAGKSQFHAKLYESHLKTFEEGILPKAQMISKIYNEVNNMPKSDFEGKDAMRNFAIKSHDIKDPFERAQKISMFKAKLHGEDPLEALQMKKIQKSMANSMRDSKKE